MDEGNPLPLTNPSFHIDQIPIQNPRLHCLGTKFPFISPSISPSSSSLSQSPASTTSTSLPESRPASRAFTTATRIRPNALPLPTYHPPDPTKKSHARKQPAGHVPRPRNAFILFRCDFVRQKKVPANVENDHRNISRIVGTVWREMSDEEKDPWVQMAETEKKTHAEIYPGYRYTPGVIPLIKAGRKKVKEGDEVARTDSGRVEPRVGGEMKGDRAIVAQGLDIRSARRSSSCPPVQATSPGLHPLATRPQNRSQTRAPPFPLYPMPRSSGRRRLYPSTVEQQYDFSNTKQRVELMRRMKEGGSQMAAAPSPVVHGPSAASRGTTAIPSGALTITANSATAAVQAPSIPPAQIPAPTVPRIQTSDVYPNHPQAYNQNQNYIHDQNALINSSFRRRRSSSWPPSATRPTIALASTHDDTNNTTRTSSFPHSSIITTPSSISELNSPPPPISAHHQKNRRAFARDLDLDLDPTPLVHVPVLHGGPYAIAPPGDAPGWDCAPAQPMEWGEWVGIGGRGDWEGWDGMDVDVDVGDRTDVFDIPNDMNFPAAEFSGYSSATISGAHASVFNEPQVQFEQAQVQSTPKLQPISSERAHTQPVFTNPFASQSSRSEATRGPRLPPPEGEGISLLGVGAFSNLKAAESSGGFTSSPLASFGHNYQPTTPAYYTGALFEGQHGHGDHVKAGSMNVPHSGLSDYGDEDEDGFEDEEDEEDGDEELEIGSMFPRMSLDADADAEGESEDEGEGDDEDMPTERGRERVSGV